MNGAGLLGGSVQIALAGPMGLIVDTIDALCKHAHAFGADVRKACYRC